MSRAILIERLADRLGDRELMWFGIRGHDSTSLLQIPQFKACFSITAALSAAKLERSVSLESLTKVRVDLDRYDIDFDDAPEVVELRREVMTRAARHSAMVTYRPSKFLSAIHFACFESADYLGMFKEQQAAFEHKPWVETALRRRGVRVVPWRYVAAEHRDVVEDLAEQGPVILRPSRTSGGVGIRLAKSASDVATNWVDDSWHFTGVAPFLADAVPLNIAGCVFRTSQNDLEVTVHPLSLQLIGIAAATNRQFGYCGNDFASVEHIPPKMLDHIDSTTRCVGHILGEMGYIGAFGVDYLLDGETLYFAEVNARLQGSTALASDLCARARHTDVLLDHLAANLSIAPAESLHVRDWVDELDPASHVVLHNTSTKKVAAAGPSVLPAGCRYELSPESDLLIEPGGVVGRVVVPHAATETGFELNREVNAIIGEVCTHE